MKILTLISGGDVGGAKTHVLGLLKALGSHITVKLVCFMEADFTDAAREMGIDITILPSRDLRAVLKELRTMIREEGFDLIHSHGSRGNFMAWLLKRSSGLPLISTVHSDWKLDYMGRPLAAMTFGKLNLMALRHMDYLIGVSDSMSTLLIQRRMAQPDRVYTIYNGVDFDRPRQAVSRGEFLRAHGVPEEPGTVYMGIAARLNPVKDIETLVRGFAAAREQTPDIRLLIAGDGPEEERLKDLARSLGVGDRVHFLGWITDTDSFYHALDINTLTSLSETFPYALTEGAIWGKATVASRVGGVPRLIDHGVSGLLFTAGDWETLGKELAGMAADPALRARSAEKLREKTRREFSLEATVQTQLSIYDSVCRRWKRKEGRQSAVTVCGAYGRGNVGDEAILEAILREIREADPDVTIYAVSRDPKATRIAHRVRAVHTFDLLSFWRLAGRTKLLLNGGGSLIQDVTSRRSLWFYLYTLAAAKRRGAGVVMYGCGIGPVQYPGDRKLSARIINRNADVITLREDHSREELLRMGVKGPEILLAADPSLTLDGPGEDRTESALLTAGLDPKGDYLCFALRPWTGFEEKAEAFARAAETLSREMGLTPVFLPIDQSRDPAAAELVAKKLGIPYHVLPGASDRESVTAILSRMKAVVSMRLHGLIFAAGQGVPLVGVVYDPKVRAFLRYIGQDRYVDLEDVTAEGLCAMVRSALAESDGESQAQAVARLRELDRVNREVLGRYLGE